MNLQRRAHRFSLSDLPGRYLHSACLLIGWMTSFVGLETVAGFIGNSQLLGRLSADDFLLKDGRSFHGTLRSETENVETKVKQYAVEIRPGVMVLVQQPEIRQHVRDSDAAKDYASQISRAEDSVESHLGLAAWCRQHGLVDHEMAHYERVLDLDSENSLARAALKYAKGKDGRWIKRDVLMTEGRGKISVAGKYRFPEIVAIEALQEQANSERIALLKEVRTWQNDVLTNNRRATESQAKLLGLAGTQASSVLAEMLLPKPGLGPRSEPPPEALRSVYVSVLARLADPVAVQTLIRLSTSDSSTPIRDQCLDAVIEIAPRAGTFAFIKMLSSDKPEEINQAGRALAALNDDVAVLPLIEHLVTKHKRQSGGNGSTNVEFGNQGSYTLGTAKPTTVEVPSRNADVLGALTTITSVNFQYDKQAWLDWYGRQHFASAGDLRRDQ